MKLICQRKRKCYCNLNVTELETVKKGNYLLSVYEENFAVLLLKTNTTVFIDGY